MTNTPGITIHTLDAIVEHVFDVTIDPGRNDGAIVIHMSDSRIVLSGEVLAAIDQARREAQADTELDANRTAAD